MKNYIIDIILIGLMIIMSISIGVVITGCLDVQVNMESQSTTRVNSAASRNPVLNDTDIQGSERTQGKSPIGVKADAHINMPDRDVTGQEK